MADLARIKGNVGKMAAQNAPESDIDAYIASEGVTLDEVRNFKVQPQSSGDGAMRGTRSFAQGLADMATFGFADEAAAGIGSLGGMLPGGHGKGYSELLNEIRAQGETDATDFPNAHLAGQAAGVVGNAAGLARGGLSLAANAAGRGASLGRVAMGGAGDGAIVGALQGVGSGTDAQSRLTGAGVGALVGTGLGAVAPYAVAGASKIVSPIVAPIMARLKPDEYAQKALIEGLRRAGKTNAEITQALRAAQLDGQDMFTVADAMGNSGQRLLSTAARNPHEGRQALVEGLQTRQMGQGDRLSNALAEGFNAPDTAAQRAALLTSQRGALADVNYSNARQGAGPVDVSGALDEAKDVLQPGVHRLARPDSGIADDSLEGVVRRAQGLLTDGKSVTSDFSAVLRAKQDIQDMIGAAQRTGRNNQVRLLSQINTRLDSALEKASPGYRQANDAFRAQSKTIDAVEAGKAAYSGRSRSADNIAQFQSMKPGEQNAFRSGYVDPFIAKVESSSISPMTNKARPLMSEKTGQEFPAFAIPQRADKMGRRIGREQRMFETANAALGGSKTADNIADAADIAQFDPAVLSNLLRGGNITGALISAVTKALSASKGLPPPVLTQLSKALMTTDPALASRLLQTGVNTVNSGARQRAILGQLMTNMGASGAARLATP